MNLDEEKSAKAERIKRLTFAGLAVLVGLNVMAMANCSGWSTRDMEVATCVVDGTIFRYLANELYAFVFYSAFIVFIPLVIYVAILWVLSRGMALAFVSLFPR